jgi:hypothetical protein
MPTYIDGLPKETTGRGVFDGVHGQVQDWLDSTGLTPRTPVPDGTSRNWLSGDLVLLTASRRSAPHRRALVCVLVGGTFRSLVGLSGTHALGYAPPDVLPVGVEGFWGAEAEERLGGNYRLSRASEHGPIEARLADPDVLDTAAESRSVRPSQTLGTLPESDRRHLARVTEGILDRLEAAQLILDGAEPEEVLDALGGGLAPGV